MSAYTDADVRAAHDVIRLASPRSTDAALHAVLGAVAPAIAARALRDFADNHVHFQTAGRMQEDLHAYADEIERATP